MKYLDSSYAPRIATQTMNPSDEVSAYVRLKRIALAREIRAKERIYLDTKYWALLRDVRLGRSPSDAVANLLSRLELLVQDGKAICPLNADIYFEILKQNDPHTLKASVQLIDDLSDGICLVPMTERIPTEVFHFLESVRVGPEGVFSLDELMWTKAAYIIGFVTPDCYLLEREDNLKIQKAFADHMWTLRLMDYLNTMGVDQAAARPSSFPDISSQLNEGKMSNLDEHKSFKSLFLCEMQGVLDIHKPEFASLMRYRFERDTGQELTEQDKARDNSGQLIANLIYHAFRLNKVPQDALPSLRVGAGLHAALRWDRNRTYKANDLFDFRHAEAAMPYCDYFFTERSLWHLLQDGNLKLSDFCHCQVHHDAAAALASLSVIE